MSINNNSFPKIGWLFYNTLFVQYIIRFIVILLSILLKESNEYNLKTHWKF